MTLPLFNLSAGMPAVGVVGGILLVLVLLGYTGAPLWSWALAGAVGLYGGGAPLWAWIPYGVLAAVFNVGPLRRQVSAGVMIPIA